MIAQRWYVVLACTAAPLVAAHAATEVVSAASSPPSAAVTRPVFTHGDKTFELVNRTATATVETDEYAAAGESLSNWTELVTVQRLTLAKPAGSDAFVAYFRKRLGEEGGSLEVLAQSHAASVFSVRFPRSERNDEQVMVCLAFVDRQSPARMNIVQYALKPARFEVPVIAERLKSWRDQFARQVEAGGSS